MSLKPRVTQNQGMTNAALVKKAMDALFAHHSEEAMRSLYTQDYVQHNPGVPTGLDAVVALLPTLSEMKLGYTLHRILEDGPLVATHTTYHNAQVFGAEKVVAFDLWRVENGRVAEHWDSIIPLAGANPSGRTQTGGATEVSDRALGPGNKQIVEAFVREVLIGEDWSSAETYVANDHYVQHNPGVADGLRALREAVQTLKIERIHRVVGEGNFVLTQSEGSWKGKPQAFYDLFRVEDSKIVEHWDVIQSVPDKMAHSNGMF